MTGIRFTKMHGCGNDYLLVNGAEEIIEHPAALARAMADRHCGVGADGLILVLPAEGNIDADARMRMFNADGSEAEMCGNGIRCVCRYVRDRGLSSANPLRIRTGAGVLTLEQDDGGRVTVDMGPPRLEWAAIGLDEAHLARVDAHSVAIEVQSETLTGVPVSMGNPHFVVFRDDVQSVELERIGPHIERHPAFPERVNAHFVQVQSRGEVTMRTWERGSGATLACGTGASAVCAAGVLTGRTDPAITAHLPGGDLQLRWDEPTDHVFMTGPAVEVFEGVWKA